MTGRENSKTPLNGTTQQHTHPTVGRTTILKLCFLSFSLAQIVSILGDRLHQFSVVGMIGQVDPASTFELFQLGVFGHVPVLLFSPFFGSLIDRTNKRVMLVVVDGFRGLVVIAIPTLFGVMGNLYAFYIPVFVLSAANLLFSPAKSALVPELFRGLGLFRVNAVLWGLGIVGTISGFVLGGWLFDYRGWQQCFYWDGASYLISLVLLLPLFLIRQGDVTPTKKTEMRDAPRDTKGMFASIRDGFLLARGNATILYGLTTQTSLFAALGVLYVIGIARVQEVLPAEQTIYLSGVATAATVGLLAASALSVWLKTRVEPHRLIAVSTAVLSSGCIGLAVSSTFLSMLLSSFAIGFGISPVIIITETILQVHTPTRFRGRIFSAREITTRSSFLVMSLVATILSAVVLKATILISIGVLLAVTGVMLGRRSQPNV